MIIFWNVGPEGIENLVPNFWDRNIWIFFSFFNMSDPKMLKRQAAALQRKKQRINASRKTPELTKSELDFMEGCPLFASRVVVHVIGTGAPLHFMMDPDTGFEWFMAHIECNTDVYADAEKTIHLITNGKTCRQIWAILNPCNYADGKFTIYIK